MNAVTDRHNYEYDVDINSGTAPANVVRMVGKNKRVVEIGCGPGSITKMLASEGNCQVTGLELDADAIDIVRPFCEVVYQADLNNSEWPKLLDSTERFDVAVAADVLEHLYDPWSALPKMVPLIKPDGYLVISLPHVGHAAVMGCIMNGDFQYRDWGLLDRTHIRFFCLKNIEDLFVQANLKIIEASFITKSPEETEFFESWSKLNPAMQEALMSNNHSEVYQVVIKAVPASFPGEPLSLIPPKPNHLRNPISNTIPVSSISWKTKVSRHLNPQVKLAVRKYLSLLGLKL